MALLYLFPGGGCNEISQSVKCTSYTKSFASKTASISRGNSLIDLGPVTYSKYGSQVLLITFDTFIAKKILASWRWSMNYSQFVSQLQCLSFVGFAELLLDLR